MTMADLRATAHAAGFPDASTYAQTGNLVLDAPGPAAAIAAAVEAAIASDLGFTTHAMVRSAAQMQAIAAVSPFPDEPDAGRIGIGFCKTKPTPAAIRALLERDFGRDRVEVRGTECGLWYPDGMGRSKMTGAVLERILGVPITVRNWRVTQALADLVA
jgi:uncharacterized protein (DUF1697 family)